MFGADLAVVAAAVVACVVAVCALVERRGLERSRLDERRQWIAALLARTPAEFAAAVREPAVRRNGKKPKPDDPVDRDSLIPEGL